MSSCSAQTDWIMLKDSQVRVSIENWTDWFYYIFPNFFCAQSVLREAVTIKNNLIWIWFVLLCSCNFVKSMCNTMACKRDSFSGAIAGVRETHRECVSHRLNASLRNLSKEKENQLFKVLLYQPTPNYITNQKSDSGRIWVFRDIRIIFWNNRPH